MRKDIMLGRVQNPFDIYRIKDFTPECHIEHNIQHISHIKYETAKSWQHFRGRMPFILQQ